LSGVDRWFSLGENAAAEAASVEAIEVLEGVPAGAALARAYRYQAALRMLDRDTDAAIDWGKRAIDLATTVGDPSVLAGAHGTVAASILLQGRRDYVADFERSIELAREHGLHVLHANAHGNRGSGAGELYRFDEAERYLRLSLQVAEQHDLESQASYALAWLGLTHVYQGRWDEAGAAIECTLGRPTAPGTGACGSGRGSLVPGRPGPGG